MAICAICKTELKNTNGLAKHIHNQHTISKKEYYDTYIKTVNPICECGKEKKFRTLGEGYRTFCSTKCRSKNKEVKEKIRRATTGVKQSQKSVDKRRSTMLERHGVACGFLNGNIKGEHYKGFFCRSSYEKIFIDFAEKYGYTLSIPKRIEYEHEGRSRWFFPDFFVEELDLIVEVKSEWTWNQQLDLNISKLVCTVEQGYDIVFIDEEHGLLDNWEALNEYLRSRQ
jgi:hypothetical protein